MSKKQPKLTPWFPGHVKPARMGWYQRKYSLITTGKIPDYWNGSVWFLGGSRNGVWVKQHAAVLDRPWRGLASDPKAAA